MSTSNHITFRKCRGSLPQIPFPFRQRINMAHIRKKRKQLGAKFQKHCWLLGRKFQLSSRKTRMDLRITAMGNLWIINWEVRDKNITCLTNASWFVTNNNIYIDLKVSPVTEVIFDCSTRYIQRLNQDPIVPVIDLLDNSPQVRRVKRKMLLDLLLLQNQYKITWIY